MTHRSSQIFALAAHAGIPLVPGTSDIMEDSDYLAFRSDYLAWSQARDWALAAHLSASPTPFRAYLPYSERVFGLAAQVAWYLDEIIVRDPVATCLMHELDDMEDQKISIRETLQFLTHFKSLLDDGYILLHGPALLSPLPDNRPPRVKELLAIDAVRAALQETTYCGLTERPDSIGQPTKLYQLSLDSGGIIGFSLNVPAMTEVSTPLMTFGERLPRVTLDVLIQAVGSDAFVGMEHIYEREIHRTLWSAQAAQSLNSAILFDRRLDAVVLDQAGVQANTLKQTASVTVFNLSVPYVAGVPASQLIDLRHEAPAAFADFRHRLLSIVQEAGEEGADLESIRLRVDREVSHHVSVLEGELRAELSRSRVQGWGLPLVAAAGVLAGTAIAAPAAALLGVGTAGAIGAVNALSDSIRARRKAHVAPFYFLWRAGKTASRAT